MDPVDARGMTTRLPHAKVPAILRAFGIKANSPEFRGCRERVRCVFSEGRRQIRLGHEGPRAPIAAARPRSFSPLAIRTLAADLLHAVLPSDCRICDGPMLGLSPVRVCDACLERVRAQSQSAGELCRRCGDALGMESARFAASMGIADCTACRTNPPAFARAVAFAAYDHEMREMLHALKFGGVRRLAEGVLSRWLAEAMLQLEPETRAGLLVVPVPLFAQRQRGRGYNQAELLARSAVKRLRGTHPGWALQFRPDSLRRVRDTKAMFELRPDQRRRNLVGAFAAGDAARLQGRDVLLIDDILTTGATANQCAKVLLKAGANAVWVATVARAQPESAAGATEDVARWDAAGVAGFGLASVSDAGRKAVTEQATGVGGTN